jgi:hypothetical protein
LYIVTGGGGGRTALRGTGADWFTDFSDQVFQYVRATVDHYTMRLEAVNADGQVFDTVEVTIPEELRKPELVPTEPLTLPEPSATPAGEGTTAAGQGRETP